jgi:hypothetical protein
LGQFGSSRLFHFNPFILGTFLTMGEIRSTRLRYIRSKNPSDLEQAIERLPFKIEIKSILFDGKKWTVWFNLPDNAEMQSLEM